MRSVCFYFQVHQPYRLRTYRFFDIGSDHHYYDDHQNRFIMRRVAEKCYLPMNRLLLDLIREYGPAFKVSFSISGTALDQIETYAPDVLDSFRALAASGSVEFLAETYSHSLPSLRDRDEFVEQVSIQRNRIKELFGQDPVTFRNTELIYSDGIGEMVAEMGFGLMLTEGAKHVLGWKSPNYMYANAVNPKLKLLLKNFRLSDDIAFRFSQQSWAEWPLTVEKFVGWLNAIDPREEVVNLFMDYETFGEHQWPETGIFEFMRALPARVFSHSDFTFNTPSELAEKLQPVSAVHVPYPISWADEERDITAWLGNELQDEAFDKLYALSHKVKGCKDPDIIRDWRYLQTSDHFYYMCTKWFSDGDVHKYFNPYGTPYEAFINYMNVLSDFSIRVDEACGGASIGEMVDQQIEKAVEIGKEVKKKTKDIGEKVRKRMKDSKIADMSLDDIAEMSDSKIRELIRNVKIEELLAVLDHAEDELKNRIIPNLGVRAKKKYTQLQDELKKVKKTDLKKYTGNIEKELNRLFKKKKA
jgi:alpha-amylase